jgi:hypothetical protein
MRRHEETDQVAGHAAWRAVDLSRDPHLVLGKRRGRGIEGLRVEVHRDLFEDMRLVCSASLDAIFSSTGRQYEPYAELERGEEYFELAVADIPQSPPSARRASSTVGGAEEDKVTIPDTATVGQAASTAAGGRETAAALLATLQEPGRLRVIDSDEFLNLSPLFYSVCWQQDGRSWVSFIRKTNPRQFFKAGRRWWQYGDTLKRIPQEPTFVFEQQMDLIVSAERIVAFSATALKDLFTDVGLAQTEVPRYVSAASDLIHEEVPLSGRSVEALNAVGKRKVSVASRLFGLAARIAELKEHGVLTSDRYREIAQDDERAASLLDHAGTFDFDESDAEVFLDVIEGRYFEDDWTGSPRRADRFSHRIARRQTG